MLSRRMALASLIGAAAGLAMDPERALWVPGAKKIFIPNVTKQKIWVYRYVVTRYPQYTSMSSLTGPAVTVDAVVDRFGQPLSSNWVTVDGKGLIGDYWKLIEVREEWREIPYVGRTKEV